MRRGYTLIELLTTVAALVILLGLMVSLARFVRHRSAEDLTRDVLARLDRMLVQYTSTPAKLDDATPRLIATSTDKPNETALHTAALENNHGFVRFFREESAGQAFKDLPLSVYDGTTLRDAWGTPLVYVAMGAPSVGNTRTGRPFFFSAGPDRQFSTVLDNQYSYDRSYEKAAGQRE